MMKIKPFRRKIIPITVLVVILSVIATSGVVYGTSIMDRGKEIGRRQTAMQSSLKDPDEIVATINGQEVTKQEFETFKLLRNQNNSYTDRELLDKMIEKQVLYTEAVNQGFEATDDEVNAAIKDVKQALQEDQNQEQYEFLKNYLDELGITEEQYWSDFVVTEYKEVFSINNLEDSLKANFIKENHISDAAKMNSAFDEYYDQYKKDLISKADVQTDIK